MSRRRSHRIVMLFAAVAFFATGAADAYGLHGCPHHDALPASAPASGLEPVDGDPRHDHEARHAGHAAPSVPAAADGREDAHDHEGPCTCIGTCTASTGLAAPLAPSLTGASPAAAAPHAFSAPVQPLPRLTAHLLPFATAPPLR